jgi:hypothetical protein
MLSPGSSIVYRNLIGKKLVVAEFGTTLCSASGADSARPLWRLQSRGTASVAIDLTLLPT